ncbi:MAG: hypothetical protein NTV40_04695 [Solirubrobacterales bacterium]|nr:hypothetical protein [Solirubrobacterales bacterium]
MTGWIQINEAATQDQAISCSNNDSSSGLSYSTDGQAYDNAGPWYATGGVGADSGFVTSYDNVGWQTGNGGDAFLSQEAWYGGVTVGSNSSAQYGSGGAAVTNLGGSGGWQTAIACVNGTGAALGSSSAVRARVRDRTIDSADRKKGTAFLAREYVLKKNVSRTDKRTCPAGMVRKGKLAYTVQEFPANNKFSWKNRSLVDVKMTAKGKNAGSVKMTLKRAKNPTVVQFQMRCGKR